MISETDVVYLRTGDNGVLSCNNMPGNTAIQWLRLDPSKTVTENTYTDGWTVNQEIPHHHRISIISSKNSTKYELRIANVTKVDSGEYRCISVAGINAQPYDVQIVVEDFTISTGIYDNPTNASNTSDTTTNSQINFNKG
ncbi:Hypothetical predicted protein [Mytilus galloprovincialis]|nr:Hypothetical predicted protein [Mytilus galloprovincialis]